MIWYVRHKFLYVRRMLLPAPGNKENISSKIGEFQLPFYWVIKNITR